jgi:hypothetical protein
VRYWHHLASVHKLSNFPNLLSLLKLLPILTNLEGKALGLGIFKNCGRQICPSSHMANITKNRLIYFWYLWNHWANVHHSWQGGSLIDALFKLEAQWAESVTRLSFCFEET